MSCPDPAATWPRRIFPNYVDSRGGAWWIHRIAPFPVSGDASEVLRRLERVVAAVPRTVVVAADDERLHAVCRTLLGFRDDLEFRFSPAEGVVHARSAARIGVYDFGVNRRRVERVRRAFGKPEWTR